MAAPRNRKHIIVPGKPITEAYRPHGRKIDAEKPPAPASRATHGRALKAALDAAVREASQRRADAAIQVRGAVPGIYVQFESQPGVSLKFSSLEDSRQGIELVAVSHVDTSGPAPRRIERATVFVPDGKVKHFVSRFAAYSKTTPKKKGERRHEDMLDPVAALRLATLRALWTDAPDAYPAEDEAIWWEVWLRRHDGGELARLMEFAGLKGLHVSLRRLQFDDRIVTLLRAQPSVPSPMGMAGGDNRISPGMYGSGHSTGTTRMRAHVWIARTSQAGTAGCTEAETSTMSLILNLSVMPFSCG